MDNTNTSSTPKTSSDAMKMIQKDIKAKWDKFSDQELASLKSRDDLVTQGKHCNPRFQAPGAAQQVPSH